MKKAEVVRWLRSRKRTGKDVQSIVDALNLTVESGGNLPTRKSRAVKALEALSGDHVSLPDEVVALIEGAEPAVESVPKAEKPKPARKAKAVVPAEPASPPAEKPRITKPSISGRSRSRTSERQTRVEELESAVRVAEALVTERRQALSSHRALAKQKEQELFEELRSARAMLSEAQKALEELQPKEEKQGFLARIKAYIPG